MAADRHLGSPRARRALAALAGMGFNFDPDQAEHFTTANGWKVDDYRQPLPPEPPGAPRPGGSFEVAQRLLRDYAFADPAIVRAVYAEDSPLEHRDMLLEGRFWGLRFRFGVRVGGLVDEELVTDGRRLRRWGWSYRTLQGHLEMGQMDYQVGKWLDSGEVEFRIHAVSRPAHIPNPVIRLGFRVFGRRVQRRFARQACRRMARLSAARALVEAAVENPPAHRPSIGLRQADGAERPPLLTLDPPHRAFVQTVTVTAGGLRRILLAAGGWRRL